MKDPVRGVFRVSSWHDVHPGTAAPGNRIVGTISGPGIADMAAEHKLEHHGHWPPGSELPIMIDRQDPSKYVILWDEAPRGIGGAIRAAMQSRQPAQDLFGAIQDAVAQQRHVPGNLQGGAGGEPIVITSSTTMDMSQLPPETAARVQAAMGEMFGAFGGAFGGAAGDPGAANEAHIARLERLAERMGGANGARIAGIVDALRQAAATSGTTAQQHGAQQYGAQQYGAPQDDFTADQAQQFPTWGEPSPQTPLDTWGKPTPQASSATSGAGQPATAVVAEVTDVEPEFGAFPPPGGIADIRLEITKPDGSFSVATTRIGFSSPERRAAIATVGNRLQVRLDPLNPAKVVIDHPEP